MLYGNGVEHISWAHTQWGYGQLSVYPQSEHCKIVAITWTSLPIRGQSDGMLTHHKAVAAVNHASKLAAAARDAFESERDKLDEIVRTLQRAVDRA